MTRISVLLTLLLLVGFGPASGAQDYIIDHTCTDLARIPTATIEEIKASLHVAYAHTSHGSQLITGMAGLDEFMGGNDLYLWSDGPTAGRLDIDDLFVVGDLGTINWDDLTRGYLDNPAHSDVNVVMWSWCGQLSTYTETDVATYLAKMSALESEYPAIRFVYMTGHLDGTGLTGNLHARNEQIRAYCRANNRVLYDFADIETYDPDHQYFGDKLPNDNCDYDSDGNQSLDGNWALEWQASHVEGVDWYNCTAAHSQALNGNLKAFAAWWLWARLVGWNDPTDIEDLATVPFEPTLHPNYPNPFNPGTTIEYALNRASLVRLTIYNVLGQEIVTLVDGPQPAGAYTEQWDGTDRFHRPVASGVYFYRLSTDTFTRAKKMVLLK